MNLQDTRRNDYPAECKYRKSKYDGDDVIDNDDGATDLEDINTNFKLQRKTLNIKGIGLALKLSLGSYIVCEECRAN